MSTTHIPAGVHVTIETRNGGRASGYTLFPIHAPDGTGLGDNRVAIIDDVCGRSARIGSFAGPVSSVVATDAAPLDEGTIMAARREWLDLGQSRTFDGPLWGSTVWNAA